MAKKYGFDWSSTKEQIKKEEESKKSFEKDIRFWKPVVNDGVCSVLLRFLPAPDGTPFIKYHDHSFDYTTASGKKRYWKRCINDFGYEMECPICSKNREYYSSNFEKDKDIARERGRKLIYVANVYIIKHGARPEDEGKTFLFQFGPAIYKKIKSKMFPSDEEKAAPDFVEFVPFDLYEGADFFLTSTKQGTFPNGNAMPNYNDSRFMPQKPFMGGDDDKIEKVMDTVHSLDEFVDPKLYPTNEEVIRILGKVLGIDAPDAPADQEPGQAGDVNNFFNDAPGPDDDVPFFEPPSTSATPSEPSVPSSGGEEMDDDAAFFKDLTK